MIQCYYKDCPNHEYNNLPRGQSGPFCDKDECTATVEEMDVYEDLRDKFLGRSSRARIGEVNP
jgi:hypothetical protein